VNIGEIHKVDIATGGDPVAAVAHAEQSWASGGHVVKLAVRHDDGCPCLDGRGLHACTCEVIGLEARRVA
jgi:hypothetical protein